MTLLEMMKTILGGFLLPFLILLFWSRMVNRFKALGGFLACFLIVGSSWLVNHGLSTPLIHQTGPIFVDMGLATAVGIYIFDISRGASFRKTVPNILAALLGGGLAGMILHLL